MPSQFLPSTETLDSLRASPRRSGTLERLSRIARITLYAYVVFIASPIRYWPLQGGIDATWRFALNYASAQRSAVASETIFTMGPLGYLLFPEHVGNNLAHGLLFQAILWLIVAAIFADIYFRASFPLRNLVLFSFCFALATPIFWFDFVGTEYLMVAGALMLITVFHLRGSRARYLAALALAGLLPMFKLSGALVSFAALAGFLVERVISRRSKALTEAALAVVVPVAVAAAVCFCVMPSVQSVLYYLRGSAEIIGGYSAAMSVAGPGTGLISASGAIAVLLVLLGFQAASAPRIARFYVLLLAGPLFLGFKQGFVRQDVHIINFFCFVALALALVSLSVNLDKVRIVCVVPLAILFFMIWRGSITSISLPDLALHPIGTQAARMLWGAVRFGELTQQLNSSVDEFPEDSRIEPEIVELVDDSRVASLSVNFTNVASARMRLKLYPVVQRYAAYTPYLDRLNAAWVRDRGPQYLLFDGQSVDGRDPWAETPAMWLEIYRWYDSRLLGRRNLLLERRAGPRFTTLETIGHFRMAFTGELRFPVSSDAVFWTLKCDTSMRDQLQKLLFRAPGVLMSIHEAGGVTRSARIIPEVLVSPVLGNYLPASLPQFYAVFQPGVERGFSVDRVLFNWLYSPSCEAEILRPAR